MKACGCLARGCKMQHNHVTMMALPHNTFNMIEQLPNVTNDAMALLPTCPSDHGYRYPDPRLLKQR
eukprot:6965441-Karenia_brevis.AAC.1